MSGRALVLPPAASATANLLADAARRRGLDVRVLSGRPVPAGLAGRAHLYGGDAFATEVAAALGTALLEPPPDWLARLPADLTGRSVAFTRLEAAYGLEEAAFVKPAAGKSFPARVYPSGRELPRGPPGGTPVLVSEPVVFAEEYRLHLLDGAVRAGSRYAVHGRLDAAPLSALPERRDVERFAEALPGLPGAVVADVGVITDALRGGAGRRYAVVEANEAWFSNCYAADPARVLDVVLAAALPRGDLRPRDRAFVRP